MQIIHIVCVSLLVASGYITVAKSISKLKKISWIALEDIADPPTMKVLWHEVESVDEEDPVLGYKIQIWEVKKIKKRKHIHHSNGTEEVVEVEEFPRAMRVNGTNVIPEGTLTELETPANTTTFSIGVKLEQKYQFVITPFTKNVEGPPSAIYGVTLHGPDWVPRQK